MRHRNYGGIVVVEPDYGVEVRPFRIEGHWEPTEKTVEVDEGPGWNSSEGAIAWGRKRAPAVLLRLHESISSYRFVRVGDLVVRLHAPVEAEYVLYSAGERDKSRPKSEEDDEVRTWPGTSRIREADVVSNYGGIVWLVQWESDQSRWPLNGYRCRWEILRHGYMMLAGSRGPAWKGQLDAAVEWGRDRAPYVLLTDGPRQWEYWSVGDDDPPGLDLPRRQSLDEWLATKKEREEYLATVDKETLRSDVRITVREHRPGATFPIPEEIEPAGGFPPVRQ